MTGTLRLLASTLTAATLVTAPAHGQAEEGSDDSAERRWSNTTELSFVSISGNSNSQTIGLKDTLTRRWAQRARFQFKVDIVRADTADDPYAVADIDDVLDLCSGVIDSACLDLLRADPDQVSFAVVNPGTEPDVGKYFFEGRYDRTFKQEWFWNTGANWYRDIDAGIVSRTVLFAGVGHRWWERDDLKFITTYGLSFTARDEETPDPDKDARFAGVRVDWEYLNMWGKVTTYTNDWTFNVNVTDSSDYTTSMTNGLAVAINTMLALKVSLQWIYNNEPALEDIDLFLDPNQAIEIGSVDIRKQKLDTVFNTSFVMNF